MEATVSLAFWDLLIVLWSGASNAQSSCSLFNTLQASPYYNQTVTSPNYPSSYPSGKECRWTITTSFQNVIKVVFDEFVLQSSFQCSQDYLELYDGSSTSSDKIGRFCGTSRPDVVYSSGTNLYVKFQSHTFPSFLRGFRFNYTAVYQDEADGVCRPPTSNNLKVVASSGMIFTPNYPINFKDGIECFWTINVPAQNKVRLTFEMFDLSSDGSSCSRTAYVEVRDGAFSYSDQLATYCGSSIPPVVESTGLNNYLWVKFYAGYSGPTRPGFKARFEAIEVIGERSNKCEPGNSNNNNLTLSGSSGTFHSPWYPSNYPPNMDCTWIITVPDGENIKLTFNTFDLEVRGSCFNDYVEVRDGKYSSSDRIGKYCGSTSKPDTITSSDRYLRVRFVSDSDRSFNDKGFEAELKILDKSTECFAGNPNNNNLMLSGSSGTFHSPLYPSNYPQNMDCTWIITVPDGKAIKLTFHSFDVQYESDCDDDYVEARDGKYSTSNKIGRYCGYSIPDSISSNDRYLRVRFVSNYNKYRLDNGFEAEFKAEDISNAGLIAGIIVAIVVFCIIIVCAVCIVKKKNRNTGARQAVPQTDTTTEPQSTPMTTMQYPPPPMAPYGQPYPPPAGSTYPPPPAGSPYPPPSVGYAPYPAHPPPAYPDVAPPPYPEPAGVPQYPPPGQSYPWAQDPKNTPQPSAPPIGP